MGILSPHGKARPFDKNADGLVRGEGCGSMLLEYCNLNSVIRATLHGSYTNFDNTKLQPGQPDQDAEERVIIGALHSAQVSAAQVRYTEMHGKITPVGMLL